jgi:hypothetical protein
VPCQYVKVTTPAVYAHQIGSITLAAIPSQLPSFLATMEDYQFDNKEEPPMLHAEEALCHACSILEPS